MKTLERGILKAQRQGSQYDSDQKGNKSQTRHAGEILRVGEEDMRYSLFTLSRFNYKINAQIGSTKEVFCSVLNILNMGTGSNRIKQELLIDMDFLRMGNKTNRVILLN